MNVPTQRKDALRTRDALLSAAEDLLSDDREASLTEIAVAAGVSHATIYRHFEDRTALLVALMELRLDRHESEVADWGAGPETFERLVRLLAGEQAKFQGLMAEIRQRDPDDVRFARMKRRTAEMFRGPLAAAQRAGRVGPGRKPEESIALLMMIDAATALHSDRATRECAAEEAADIVLKGISA